MADILNSIPLPVEIRDIKINDGLDSIYSKIDIIKDQSLVFRIANTLAIYDPVLKVLEIYQNFKSVSDDCNKINNDFDSYLQSLEDGTDLFTQLITYAYDFSDLPFNVLLKDKTFIENVTVDVINTEAGPLIDSSSSNNIQYFDHLPYINADDPFGDQSQLLFLSLDADGKNYAKNSDLSTDLTFTWQGTNQNLYNLINTKKRYAAYFDGTNYLELENQDLIDNIYNSDSWTISLYFNSRDFNDSWARYLSIGGQIEISHADVTNNLTVSIRSGTQVTDIISVPIEANHDYNLIVVKNQDEYTAYLDGKSLPISNNTRDSSTPDNPTKIFIGKSTFNSDALLHGQVWNVRIFNRALTVDELPTLIYSDMNLYRKILTNTTTSDVSK